MLLYLNMFFKICISSISWNKNTNKSNQKYTPVIIYLRSDILIQALETFFLPEPWQIHLGQYFLTGDSLRPLLWILCHLFPFHCICPTTTTTNKIMTLFVEYNIEQNQTTVHTHMRMQLFYFNFGMFKILNARRITQLRFRG